MAGTEPQGHLLAHSHPSEVSEISDTPAGVVDALFHHPPIQVFSGTSSVHKACLDGTPKPVGKGVNLLASLNNWLVLTPSHEGSLAAIIETVESTQGMGFRFNFLESVLMSAQSLQWLSMVRDTQVCTLHLSLENVCRVQ